MSNWHKVTFDKAFADVTAEASKLDQSEFLSSGDFPIVDQGQNAVAGYTNDRELIWQGDLPVLIFGDHTRILKYVDFPFVLGADGTKVLKASPEIFPLFAYYQLLSINIPSAGYSRHFKFLKEFSFNYPPFEEQKRIASLLARADRLRQLRRVGRELSDSLIQSVFLEMFGDPARNDKNWDRCIIDDAVEFSQYGTSEKSNAEKRGDPVLGMGNITFGGRIELNSLSYVELTKNEFSALKLKAGDVIFNRTNSTDLVGKTAYWSYEFDAVIASYLVKLRLKKNVLPEFFVAFLNMPFYKRLFQERCKKAVGQSNISPTLLKEFPIFVPPFGMQEQFAGVAALVEGLRGRMSEAERQAEQLFQGLLAEAFGEL